ncbi:MAG: hypothetical protein CMM60_03090 [Rhodospirillaceae bacterium]|jgi:hypothetical protein|nr:hypothetical protein [Rhodospirillaceae bacterium]|tara:strand:- start:156 stop:1238 length:1083 start_codon:yes stop_codon:yes gene_type:complete
MVLGTVAVLVGGCALPLPVQVASWALDGLSYLMTEKTIADHGISVLAQKDCAVLRGLLDDGKFCRDYDDTGIMVADSGAGAGFAPIGGGDDGSGGDELAALTDHQDAADFDTVPGTSAATDARPIIGGGVEIAATLTYQPLFFEEGPPVFFEDGPQLAGYPLGIAAAEAPVRQAARAANGEGSKDGAGAEELADFETAAGPEFSPESGPGETLEPASNFSEPVVDETAVVALPEPGRELGNEPEAGLYFVIGSFRQRENARKLRRQYRILTPSVLAANLERGTVFRVVVGPFEQGDAKRVHRSIYRAGITDSWAIRVQPGQWSMAMVDPPAEAPIMAELKPEPRPLTAMDYVQLLAQLIY